MRKKYKRRELNKLGKPQLIGLVLSMQRDLKNYDNLIAATNDYRLGIKQLKKQIDKVLKRTKNLEDVRPGMII